MTESGVKVTTIKLPHPGERVGIEFGPGEYAKDNQGIVLTLYHDDDGPHALVLMDTAECMICDGLKEGPGIGWHKV